jgi:hypothetical protein
MKCLLFVVVIDVERVRGIGVGFGIGRLHHVADERGGCSKSIG